MNIKKMFLHMWDLDRIRGRKKKHTLGFLASSCLSQIGYSQSASLLAHNLIAAIAAFPWESALPRKQGSPNPPLSPWRLRSGGLPWWG